MPKPVCFMVMPYGERDTGAAPGVGTPRIDFEALWADVYRPVIETLGYRPIRADQDVGAVIVKGMIERLTLADLVIADITIANANVYYEIGVRHAAAERGCILLSAKWAKPAFDLAQIRHIQFPIDNKTLTPAEADSVKQLLIAQIPSAYKSDQSPIWQLMPGYPPPPPPSDENSFADLMQDIADFQGRITTAVRTVNKDERKAAVQKLIDDYLGAPAQIESVGVDLIPPLRDYVGFAEVVAYIERLPDDLRNVPFVKEQYALAVSKSTKDHDKAIAMLESLIQTSGETSERRGLIGGRYKKLWAAARDEDKPGYLDLAIENYLKAMYLDLNDFYSPSNLPRLLRRRGQDGDEQLAVTAAEITRAGCERKMQSDPSDPWLGQTLLGQAVDARDLAQTRQLVRDISKKRFPSWQIDTTSSDLAMSMETMDDDLRKQFADALAPLAPKKP